MRIKLPPDPLAGFIVVAPWPGGASTSLGPGARAAAAADGEWGAAAGPRPPRLWPGPGLGVQLAELAAPGQGGNELGLGAVPSAIGSGAGADWRVVRTLNPYVLCCHSYVQMCTYKMLRPILCMRL